MDEAIIKLALDRAKRSLRASTIMGDHFRPHAFVPIEFSFEKINEMLKEAGWEGELPEIPDDVDEDQFKAMAVIHLDFSHKEESLKGLGHILSLIESTNVIVVCDNTVEDLNVLCVASIDLKEPDNMILVPYQKEEDDDVAFGDESESGFVDEDIRNSLVEGFLSTESSRYVTEHPEADTDAYVDNLTYEFPNAEGELNEKEVL